jgi:ribonuclease Z
LITNYTIHVKEIDLENGELIVYPPMNRVFSIEKLESSISKKKFDDASGIKKTSNYTVKVLEAEHSAGQNFSFVLEERDPPGKFNPERAEELGVPKGYLWSRLQQGNVVILDDGSSIDPVKSGILGESRKGRIIVISGDTMPTKPMRDYLKAHEVTLLIHEATFLDELSELAKEKKHSTAKDGALLAKEGNVKKLILTHFSARYLDALDKIEDEAREHFENIIVATDNLVIDL